MKLRAVKSMMLVCLLGVASNPGFGQDIDAGRDKYLSTCASCHGGDGKGKGPRAAKLRKKPADLTMLAKKNKGTFPYKTVYAIVDGRNVPPPHGAREMPIWGCRRTPPPTEAQPGRRRVRRLGPADTVLDLPCESEAEIASRIGEVVDYVSRIQEK
jgi:hypothetical protein